MSAFPLGEIYSLLAAFTWSFALVLFKRSGETVGPQQLTLFKNTVAIILLLVTIPLFGEGLTIFEVLDRPVDWYILFLSGIIGISIADVIMFHALNLVGVGLLTIAECAYAPSVVLLAAVLIGEPIAGYHYAGGSLIVLGVLISSTHRPSAHRTRKQIAWGMFLASFSVALMAFGVVIAKPVIEKAPILSASAVRLVAAAVALAAIMAANPKRRELFAVLKPSASWKACLPASFFGAYLAMIFWIGGFKYTTASTAGLLNQTSLIMSLILASVILKEPFSLRKGAAVALALAGVLIILLSG